MGFILIWDEKMNNKHPPNDNHNQPPENIFTDNPAFNGPVQVQSFETTLANELKCRPLDHTWMYNVTVDLNNPETIDDPETNEPQTETVCVCGQKYWIRHPDFPRIRGHGEYVLN